MPQTQTAIRAVYDFGAPSAEGLVLGFRVRNQKGGKIELLVENPISARPATPGDATSGLQQPITYSIQVAPALATGLPGTFIATTVALNLEAVTDVVVGAGQSNSHTLLLGAGRDAFVLMVASGGERGQLQVVGDDIWDLWRTANTTTGRGAPDLTPV